MLEILRAHGLEAGPTQRPLLVGALSGMVADLPAIAILTVFGSFVPLGVASAHGPWLAAGLHLAAMGVAGLAYGAIFQRAANDPRGAWLFGLAYGFVVWMLGPVPLLQWLPDEPLLRGSAAAGVLVSQLAWGLTLGVLFPYVHRPFKSSAADARARKAGREMTSSAARN
jgi:hypothetical protein